MSGSVSAEDPLETSGNSRRPGPPELIRPVTTVESSVATSSRELRPMTDLQMPGIWSPHTREQYLQQEQRQQVMPQNLMPPISPSSQMRHAATEFTFGEQTSRPLASLAESTPRHLSITSMPGREEPVADLDTGESRPAKRRKMALDDMVND
ncbi:hypothetical protein FE257_012261 [Aspergillus nanangensis]|uniref:Uncharacterized protein n=1 Tax=Aspergillus nanangensis TaxID=2582783 RepID=A0AAD4GQU9_ASPNN|nr:hypothetical protein FE257_012261 [Aspergillus nanangensis]